MDEYTVEDTNSDTDLRPSDTYSVGYADAQKLQTTKNRLGQSRIRIKTVTAKA